MVFNETTNHDVILLSKQGRTQLIYSTELTTEHVFANFTGNCPVDIPLIAGSASKTCQHHSQTRAANLWDLSKAINKTLLAFGSFSQWTLIMHKPHNWVDLYVDTTTENLLELEHHTAFAKLTRWIMKTRYSKYSYALSIHSDIRAKP